ncbi:MAG: S9 family peptidase, partial [Proteobacteria bacterium]|nr:S9 family peptidase [Pseudomonadota bacterium]
MKKINIILIFLLFYINTSIFAKQIPLADFAQKSQFKTIKISPDGKHIAYTFEEGSEVKLGIMNRKSNKGVLSFDVGSNREVISFWWLNNNRVGFLGANITGWLDGAKKEYELAAVNLDGTKRKNLWGFKRAGVRLVSLLDSDDKHILVTKSHFADKGEVSLFKMNVYNGKLRYMADSPNAMGGKDAKIVAISVDLNDVPRVGIERDPQDKDDFYDDIIRLHVKNSDGKWENLNLPKIKKKPAKVSPRGFNKDNTIFYFSSDYDLVDGGTSGLFQYDFNTKKITKLFRNADVDITSSVRDPEGALIG